MSRPIKRLDLLLKEVVDPVSQENFWRIKNELEALKKSIDSTGAVGPSGPAGPPGVQGAPGAGANFEVLSGETMPALKFVYIGADGKIYLGNSTVYATSLVVGITLTAGAINTIITVQPFGTVNDSSFNFGYSNPIFLTTLGNFSVTVPISGHRVKLGQGLNNGQIFVDIDETIIL